MSKMQGLARLGGSGKYKNIDSIDLAPPLMVADPTRDRMKPDSNSLSYNNMVLRQDGGVLTRDHIREMRERQGYCLTCSNEPTQLFEIKRSKINPLFRAKEAIDVLHVSYNGICLVCNPHMDPNRLTRRESFQRGQSRRGSMDSKSISVGSIESFTRSRSNSPPEGRFDASGGPPKPAPPQKLRNVAMNLRDRIKHQGKPNKDDLFSPLRKGTSGSDVTAQETPNSRLSSDHSFDAFGTPANGVSEIHRELTPGSQHSGSSLGSMIRSNRPSIIKSNIEEFSVPDFSQGSTAFRSHRKAKQDKDSLSSSTNISHSGPIMKSSKTSLTIVKEETRETSAGSSNTFEFFANFDEPSFTPGKPKNKKSLSRLEPSLSGRERRSKDSFFDNDDGVFQTNDSLQDAFSGCAIRQDSNPFESEPDESESESESDEPWSAFETNETHHSHWKEARRGRLVERQRSGADMSSADDSFLAPPSISSSVAPPSMTSSVAPPSMTSSVAPPSISRAGSEISLNIHDAILRISGSGAHHDSMTPSQLIAADEQLMLGISGVKLDVPPDAFVETTAEIEDLKSLLQDVAAAGSSDVLVDMLVATIRENTNSSPIQEICLKQLWDHSKFNEAHKSQIMNAGLDVDIIRAMKLYRRSKMIQKNASGCLWSLSVSEWNRPALARAGAVKLLFRALEDFVEDEEVLEVILGALRTLSPDKNVRDAIVPLLGARRVCRAMGKHRSSTAIQRDGCAFLSNVSVDIDNQMVSTVHNDELAAVVRALGDHLRNESVVSSACFALKNYTYEEKNLRNLRRFEDVIPLLEDASKYSTKAEIRLDADEIRERIQLSGQEDDALEEIAYSSLRDAMQSPRMTVDQAVETIRDVMKQYEWSEKLLVFGLGSLLSLSRQSEEYMTRITQFDVLKIIVHSMYKQQVNANVQHRGCETLKFLAEQGNRPRTMICDVDGSSILISALRFHRNNEIVKAVAIAALEELSKDPRCAHLINKELLGDDCDDDTRMGNSLASFGESFKTTS